MKNTAKKNIESGFTLVEIMVAVAIFAMVMLVATGAILSMVAANKKAQAMNSVINNLNFSLESMMRDLRTGYNYNCGGAGVTVADCSNSGDDNISFYSSQYDTNVTYELDVNDGVGSIVRTIDGDSFTMTAPEIDIDTLNFYVVGTERTAGGNTKQARILITIGGSARAGGQQTEFKLQTSVSQRRLDI